MSPPLPSPPSLPPRLPLTLPLSSPLPPSSPGSGGQGQHPCHPAQPGCPSMHAQGRWACTPVHQEGDGCITLLHAQRAPTDGDAPSAEDGWAGWGSCPECNGCSSMAGLPLLERYSTCVSLVRGPQTCCQCAIHGAARPPLCPELSSGIDLWYALVNVRWYGSQADSALLQAGEHWHGCRRAGGDKGAAGTCAVPPTPAPQTGARWARASGVLTSKDTRA